MEGKEVDTVNISSSSLTLRGIKQWGSSLSDKVGEGSRCMLMLVLLLETIQ